MPLFKKRGLPWSLFFEGAKVIKFGRISMLIFGAQGRENGVLTRLIKVTRKAGYSLVERRFQYLVKQLYEDCRGKIPLPGSKAFAHRHIKCGCST